MQKNEFVYAIPSYKRANKQITVDYLNKSGVPKEKIYVFVQTEADKEEYENSIGTKAEIVMRAADGVARARNNVLNTLVESNNVVMLDDDIKSIGKLADGKIKRFESSLEFEQAFLKCFEMCGRGWAQIFGVYPVYNAYFMEQSISMRTPINTVFGFLKGFKYRYDESYDTKEDAALCAKLLASGRQILRFNYLTVDADHRKTKDGYIDSWHQEENLRCVRRLISEFPTVYKMQTNKPWEVRSIIKDKKYGK